jgi:hypothetical protein
MSNRMTVVASSLVSIAFAAAFVALLQIVAASAGTLSGISVAPAYGTPMLTTEDELF